VLAGRVLPVLLLLLCFLLCLWEVCHIVARAFVVVLCLVEVVHLMGRGERGERGERWRGREREREEERGRERKREGEREGCVTAVVHMSSSRAYCTSFFFPRHTWWCRENKCMGGYGSGKGNG
jgi:hypothetical protein